MTQELEPDQVHQVAHICECGSDQIATTLNNLLHDATFYERLRSGTFRAREVFNWQHEEKALIAIYKDL